LPSHMTGICHINIPPRPAQIVSAGARQQVETDCLKPKWRAPLAQQWITLPIDQEGHSVELLPPPLAIAALLFHPKNVGGMHWEACEQETRPGSGVRAYGHPFTCDEALRCQAEVAAKPAEPGVTQVVAGVNLGDDKTEVERMASAHAIHLKMLNTGAAEWFERQSKLLLAIFPNFKKDEDAAALDNTKAKKLLYQRALSLLLVLLEVCARLGIKMTHRSPPARRPYAPAAASTAEQYDTHMTII